MDIVQSVTAYESWLRAQLGSEIVESDIEAKHKKMCLGPFPFLRGTYWRWAETVPDLVKDLTPALSAAPSVLAVGDIHLENFGTWRDAEGRLVWGVNDFDEAADMPYILDLVRLATSAVLGQDRPRLATDAICTAITDGYDAALDNPKAFILDAGHRSLRQKFDVPEADRAKFWDKYDPTKQKLDKPGASYVKAVEAARPEPSVTFVYWRRTAGTGSLGRPRWVGAGSWRGGPLLREAKAMLPSGWLLAHKGGRGGLRCEEIATGPFRAPDPWYHLIDKVLVRRLSPNNRKLAIEDAGGAGELINPKMLEAMGRDLAAVHLGTAGQAAAIKADLGARKRRWFGAAVEAAAEAISREQKAWRKACK